MGSYNKIPQTGLLINNRNLFFIVLKAGKSKIKAMADSVSGESSLLVHNWLFVLLCPHMVERTNGLFHKGSNLIHKVSTLITYSPPETSSPNTITLGISIAMYGFQET